MKTAQRCLIRWSLLLLAAVGLTACGGDESGGVATGQMQVGITDAAPETYSAVMIAIKEVRAVPAGQENRGDEGLPLIAEFPPPTGTEESEGAVDVLTLQFSQQFLGEATVPAGDYHQFRLVLWDNDEFPEPVNYVVLKDGRTIPIKNPSGEKKVTGHVQVGAGETAAVVLDFDPERAIVKNGNSNLIFKPNGIRVVRTGALQATFGALVGEVVDAAGAPLSGAIVSARTDLGLEAARTQVDSEDGTFRLFLPEGGYVLEVQAEGYAPYSSPDLYPVTAGEDFPVEPVELTPPVE